MIYTVTLNPSLDYVMRLDEFEPGKINRAKTTEIMPGGKGINVSMLLHNLGMESVALGFVAGFVGTEIERSLQAYGVKTDFVRLEEGCTRINVKVKAGEESDINAAGPLISKEAIACLMDQLGNASAGDYVVLAGSIPGTMGADTYQRIMERLSGRGIEFVVDAEGKLLCEVLPLHPFMIKPNNHELSAIVGRELRTPEEIRDGAIALRNMGARNVLVSMGKDGAMLFCENGSEYSVPAIDGKMINTVGAGDSMVAGFIYGYETTKNYEEALCWGNACGSATACSSGIADSATIQDFWGRR